jgi:hypothetical protein
VTACPALDYYGVTPAQWSAAKAEVLAKYGIEITSDKGTAEKDGITIGWNYDGTNASVQVVGNTFMIPCDFLNAQIDAAVKAGLGRA